MSQHTPGPWSTTLADESSNGVRWWIRAPAVRSAPVRVQPHGQFVAQVGAGGTTALNRRAEVEANARLIAAAPDLLDALQPFAWAFHGIEDESVIVANLGGHVITVRDCRLALAAIAKAEGRS